ncbi:hypothetical protein RHSIM_Rhsim13G0104600 [Rhododendron simsii]|uniref:RING-type domain-containing protein n=1 Tax=Rhododendron simsii TaxID=118357 RepID=A0A834FZV1_RHOSS|nr:hypothetical protein RHSIM_Rhsim13G0104600 [Rhododendron simsii]
MPKEKKAPSLSSDRVAASPYHGSPKTDNRNVSKNRVKSVGEESNWEETRCPICMEVPHNAVLLLCSNSKKGCRPYMCNTSNLHSNCLRQFCASNPTLLCPLCRGTISTGWIDVEPAPRELMNSMPRSCSVETCKVSGTFTELEKHASSEHPPEARSVADTIRQQRLLALESERDMQDIRAMDLDGDFASIVAEESGSSWHANSVVTLSSVFVEMSVPSDSSRQAASNSSGVSGQSRYRRTARMRAGYLPRRQLASR